MSGTFNHLETALKELNEKYSGVKFTRFDTKSISFGAGYQVYFAVKYFQEGHTIDETIEFLKDFTHHVSVNFMVDDLMHLYRGGRLSRMSAFLGSALGIKPILQIPESGKLEVVEKVKGEKKAINYFMTQLENNGLDLDKYPIVLLDADNASFAEKIENAIREKYPNSELWHYPVGPVIGAHAGPGTVAVIFHSKTR